MNTMSLGKNVRTLRERYKWTLKVLSDASGVDVGTISAIENRPSRRSEFAPQLALALGVPLEVLVGNTLPEVGEQEPPRHGPAQVVSLPAVIVTPVVPWERLMTAQLPERFEVVVPDDAMAPRVSAGEVVVFSTSVEARPGDGILVADQRGNVFFRLYRQRVPGQWEAHALNDAYQPLSSSEDGLRVLAVLVGVQARWG